ncbi:MAG: hypothetical protein R3Y44_05510 [Rikenellaceae bacterium]
MIAVRNIIILSVVIFGIISVLHYNKAVRRFMENFVELFDRMISGGIKKQLIWYGGMVVILLGLFVLVALLMDSPSICGSDNTTWDKIRGIIQHFIDPGNLMEEKEGVGIQIFTFVVTILGMIVFSGLLLTTLINAIDRRIDDINNGRTVYKNIKNHYIIIGSGEVSNSLLSDIFENRFWKNIKDLPQNQWHDSAEAYRKFREMCPREARKWVEYMPKVVIFTSQDIPALRSNTFSYFSSNLKSAILFYSGDIESEEQLSNLNFHSAKEVYVLGEMDEYGRDTKNLEAVNKISRHRGADKELLTVHVQFDRLTSYSIIQRLALPKSYTHFDGKPNILMRPFNFYENIARQLWGFTGAVPAYERLDFEPVEGEKYVHLLIAGFNRMGRALLFEALRLCHFPNYVEADAQSGTEARNKTKITVIDKEMNDQLSTFLAEFPYLDQIRDVEITYMNNRIEDEQVRDLIARESESENALLTVAICLQDPDYSLSAGLTLPWQAYYRLAENRPTPTNTRILIRQELQKGMQEVLDADVKRFVNVHTFGMLTSGVTSQMLNDDIPMCVGAYFDTKWLDYPQNDDKKVILEEYRNYIVSNGLDLEGRDFIDLLLVEEHRDKMMEFATRLWLYTSEDFRFANRYQVDAYINHIVYEQQNDKLAQMEHMRWNADRSIIGYRDMSAEKIKDTDYQIHKLIVPFNELDVGERRKKEIEKDEDVIQNMNRLFKVFGVDKYSLVKRY